MSGKVKQFIRSKNLVSLWSLIIAVQSASLNFVHFAGFLKRLRTSVAWVKLCLQALTCGRAWGPGSGCCCHTGGRCRAVWSHACATPPPHPHLHSVSCTAHHDWGSVTAHTQRGVSIRNWTQSSCQVLTLTVTSCCFTPRGPSFHSSCTQLSALFLSGCELPLNVWLWATSQCLAVSYLSIVSAHLSASVTNWWSTVYNNNKQSEWQNVSWMVGRKSKVLNSFKAFRIFRCGT